VRETEAHIQQARGNLAEAEKLLQQVIGDSAADVSLRWESETRLAEVYAAQQRHVAAEALYRRALERVDAARAALGSEELRISFLTTASDFYNSYIDFLVTHGRARDALQVAEHSRARTLSEGLGLKAKMSKASFQPEQAAKRAHAVVLAYWLKGERSYLWTITPQKVEAFVLPPAEQIETVVHAYGKALSGPRDVLETANASGQQLYSMLVVPAENQIAHGSHVMVVSDGVLHTLNFETLLAPSPQLHYWIEDVELTNSPSLELLAAKGGRKATNGRILLIGNPLAANADFPRLAQAKLEMETVQKHFAPEQCTALEGGQATARAYLSADSGQYSYIHFGTHGTASRVAPLESSIILSPNGDVYKLYARDITSHPLRAELVTISACYGAGTRAYTGEGLVGLSWAFLRAGAHNVVAALWEVNDASTPQLMGAMYEKLRDGASPAEALRFAKLEMLHSQGVYRRSFYWGAFQCYRGY
jgi:CHAT domain-containing protein